MDVSFIKQYLLQYAIPSSAHCHVRAYMREKIRTSVRRGQFSGGFVNLAGEILGWVLEASVRGLAHMVACMVD